MKEAFIIYIISAIGALIGIAVCKKRLPEHPLWAFSFEKVMSFSLIPVLNSIIALITIKGLIRDGIDAVKNRIEK